MGNGRGDSTACTEAGANANVGSKDEDTSFNKGNGTKATNTMGKTEYGINDKGTSSSKGKGAEATNTKGNTKYGAKDKITSSNKGVQHILCHKHTGVPKSQIWISPAASPAEAATLQWMSVVN